MKNFRFWILDFGLKQAAGWRLETGGKYQPSCASDVQLETRNSKLVTPNQGTILVVTMWLLLGLTALVLVLSQTMRVEALASANNQAAAEAQAIEDAAIQYILSRVDGLEGIMPDEVDMPCAGIRVGSGAFWIINPNPANNLQTNQYNFSLVDEAGKVNLNTATVTTLQKLPLDMDTPDAILDWRDTDSTVRTGGAESEYYLLLSDPYECKNANFETVGELALVKGATAELLYGEDANRNGLLDENEDDANLTDPPDNSDGKLDRGLLDLVTVYSREPNSTGRINVNTANQIAIQQLISQNIPNANARNLASRIVAGRQYQNIIDFYFRSGLTREQFDPITYLVGADNTQNKTGLINVNTAPTEVLYTLNGLDEADVNVLIGRRDLETAGSTSIAWVTEALPRNKAIAIGSQITGRTCQFGANILSVAGNGRAFKRCWVVVDASDSPPRVLYRQDTTALGWPLPGSVMQELRAGLGIDQVITNQGMGTVTGTGMGNIAW